ncbi:MAG: GNAT family N-acetyltransferase [Chloroflexota bacterium]
MLENCPDMVGMKFPALETARLRLRELHEADIERLFEIFSDPQVTQFYNIRTFSKPHEARTLFERRQTRFSADRGICWAIELKSESKVIGTCGFNAWFEKRQVGDLGYELERPYWNQGIMTEALKPIVQYGFEHIGLVQQRAWVIPQNKASSKVLLKIGFESQGVQLARGYWDGTFHDLELLTATVPNPPDITFPI